MKMSLKWFVGFAAVLGIVLVVGAAVVMIPPANKAEPGAISGTAAVTNPLSGSAAAASDPDIAALVAQKREVYDLMQNIRAAKNSGHAPDPELYQRLRTLVRHERSREHLDQGGEDCSSAAVITNVPYFDSGTTTNYADDIPECGGFGSSPDVTYLYVPVITGFYHISLCGSQYDSKLAVYSGSCTGTPIACNDDGAACGDVSSDIPMVELTSGISYYIVVDGWGNDSYGDYFFYVEEVAAPQTGDVCGDPIVIASLPYNVENQSNCTFLNNYGPGTTCLSTWDTDAGPDVVYSFTLSAATSVEVIMLAHQTDPPQGEWMMPGVLLTDHCPPDHTCLGEADNWTTDGFTPLVIPCQLLSAGTYYIMIDNGTWFHPCFSYDLIVQTCGPCNIVSESGDIEEVAEPFPLPGTFSINDPNGGCNNDTPFAPQFQTITGNTTIHGRTFTYLDSITNAPKVDSDWYRIVLANPMILNCTYRGESELRFAMLEGGCPSLVSLNGVMTTPCGTRSVTTSCLDPGEYYVRITKGSTAGGPDPSPLNYRVTFAFTPCVLQNGRCCYTGGCVMNTHPECEALEGYWFADQNCDEPCPPYPPNDRCQHAGVPASLPATFTGDNTYATNDCSLEGDPQVWHVFTTTATHDIQVDYCGTQNFHSFNPWLYASCPCDNPVMLEAVDWGFCFPTTAMTGIWRDVPAGTWYISVTMYNPNSIGPYTIHVDTISGLPPANDECTSATPIVPLPFGAVTVTGSTLDANASCMNSCDEGGFTHNSSGNDVFYSIELTTCRRLALALGTSDMHLSVYQGLNNCCQDPAWLCNDDDANFVDLPAWDDPGQHPGNSQSYVAADFTPGTYLIRVGKFGAQAGAYTLTVYDNGSCDCAPPDPPADLTVIRVNNNIQLHWSTDAASAARGTYRIYSSPVMAPVGDPNWTIVADNITPVVGAHILYYSAPFGTQPRNFYYVTGLCSNNGPH